MICYNIYLNLQMNSFSKSLLSISPIDGRYSNKTSLLQNYFSEYALNSDRIKESHMTVNYNFLVKLYSELTQDQKIKFSKNLQVSQVGISKTG